MWKPPLICNARHHFSSFLFRTLARLLNQAFHQIRHPSLGQHLQLVSILHHICNEPIDSIKVNQILK